MRHADLSPDVADAVRRRDIVWIFWLTVTALVVMTSADFFLLGIYGDSQRETFGPLAKTMRLLGIHGAVWLCRAVTYPFLFVMMCLPRSKYANYFMLALCILYFTALSDYLFATGAIASKF